MKLHVDTKYVGVLKKMAEHAAAKSDVFFDRGSARLWACYKCSFLLHLENLFICIKHTDRQLDNNNILIDYLTRYRKRERRRGRQKKRWEDNIKEWTGMEFADSQRAVENRETWRVLVRKSSMVPQRSLRVMGK